MFVKAGAQWPAVEWGAQQLCVEAVVHMPCAAGIVAANCAASLFGALAVFAIVDAGMPSVVSGTGRTLTRVCGAAEMKRRRVLSSLLVCGQVYAQRQAPQGVCQQQLPGPAASIQTCK